MKVRFTGSWESINMTPTIDVDYHSNSFNYLTPKNIAIGGISFAVGFSLFYSDKANAFIIQAIKYAIDYVMGKVTDLSFDQFGEFWKTEQKKSADNEITAYARSVDALNEVIKLEKNQRLNRTLTMFQTECKGVEVAQELQNSQYNAGADRYQSSVIDRMSASSSGQYANNSYQSFFEPEEAAAFGSRSPEYSESLFSGRSGKVNDLLKESVQTASHATSTNDDNTKLAEQLRFVHFLTMETSASVRQGLRVELGDNASIQSRMAYGRLATIGCRNSVVTGIATREVLNRFKQEHGGTGRNHALQFMVNETYYSEEWQKSIQSFVDPVPAAAEWVRVLGHRFEFIREEYRSNEEVILLLSCLILNRLDSPFVRNTVARAMRSSTGGL